MILIIDHYDSFIDMIRDYLMQLGYDCKMLKTDQLHPNLLDSFKPSHIVIGPGPGHPEAPSLRQVYRLIDDAIDLSIPILGVCLGHQIIASYFNSPIVRAEFIAHGFIDQISHNGGGIFQGLASPMQVTRYHSLLVKYLSEDAPLKITATSSRGEIMAFEHVSLPIYGIQFHPESIMTVSGLKLFANFLFNNYKN